MEIIYWLMFIASIAGVVLFGLGVVTEYKEMKKEDKHDPFIE